MDEVYFTLIQTVLGKYNGRNINKFMRNETRRERESVFVHTCVRRYNEKQAITERITRENLPSSGSRKSVLFLLSLRRSGVLGDPPASRRAHKPESRTKYPTIVVSVLVFVLVVVAVVVRVQDDRDLHGKLRSLRARWEKAGSPQLSFIVAR